MTTDDIHDLFDNDDEADESDGPAEEPESTTDEPGGSEEWNEFPLRDGEESGETTGRTSDDTAESPTMAFEGSVEDDTDGLELTDSTTSGDVLTGERDRSGSSASTPSAEPPTAEDTSVFESDRVASSSSPSPTSEDDADEFGSTEPTTSPGKTETDDVDEFESTGSPSMSFEEAAEDDTDAHESTESSTVSSKEPALDDTEGPRSTTASSAPTVEPVDDERGDGDSTTPPSPSSEASVEEETDALDPTESTTPPEETPAVNRDDPESAEATTVSEEAPPVDRDVPESGDATNEAAAMASADGTTAEDHDTDEFVEATTDVAEPAVEAHDEPSVEDHDEPTFEEHDESTVDDRDDVEEASPNEPESVARAATSGTATGEQKPSSNRLPTGIDVLDEAMGGGIPPGRLVVLVADPGVQSELIVDSILAQRDTLYVTTDRPKWEVMKDIEPGLGSGEVMIRDHTPDTLLSGVDLLLDELGTSWNFVLDSVNELELVPRQRYRIFLSDVKQRLFETGSIGLLTGVTVGHESARDLTLRRADIVLQLETRTTDHEIENRLSVPKFRGGAALTETVKLELTDQVKVDTSWDGE